MISGDEDGITGIYEYWTVILRWPKMIKKYVCNNSGKQSTSFLCRVILSDIINVVYAIVFKFLPVTKCL